jgi:glycosyltransferase involved in cell wall biosynthesis
MKSSSDDGSTDDTAQVVSSYGQQVRYFCQENKGKPAALNAGIGKASGDAIVVLDDDDFLPPWALSLRNIVLAASFVRLGVEPAPKEEAVA